MHRKLTLVLTVLALCAGLFAQPASEAVTSDATPVRVAALKGPTAIGMLQMMEDAQKGLNPVSSQGFAEIQSVEARSMAKAGQIR